MGEYLSEQRQEIVKLSFAACQPCSQDSNSDAPELAFKAYAYCMKHSTLDEKPCPAHWRVQGGAGVMQIARLGASVGGLSKINEHGPLPRMVKGVTAS